MLYLPGTDSIHLFVFVKHMGEDPTTIDSWILLLEVSISPSGSELTIESLTAVGALFVLLVMSEPSCDGSIWGTLLRLGQWNQLSVVVVFFVRHPSEKIKRSACRKWPVPHPPHGFKLLSFRCCTSKAYVGMSHES